MGTREIRKVFAYFDNNQEYLTPSQQDFVRSMKKYYRWKGTLTDKQVACLIDLRESILITQ